jgi:hypothetical protein
MSRPCKPGVFIPSQTPDFLQRGPGRTVWTTEQEVGFLFWIKGDDMSGKKINKDDKVITVYGEYFTVETVYGEMIYVYEHQNVIHASKVIEVNHE